MASFEDRFTRGDTFRFRLTLTGDAGQPLDPTGHTLRFTAKTSLSHPDAQAVVALALGAGLTIVNGPAGEVDGEIPPAATLALPADRSTILQADAQLTEADGRVTTLVKGTLTVEPGVTEAS